MNGHVQLANQNALQQQHLDHKIANALLNKGTRNTYKSLNQQDRAWLDMRLHESHEVGGFGVTHKTVSRHAASYTNNARFVSSWAPLPTLLSRSGCGATTSSIYPPGVPPLCTLKRLHEDLLQKYDCSDLQAAAQPPQPSAPAAALLPRRAQTRSLSTLAPRTTATVKTLFRSSTASTRRSSGVRFSHRYPPAPRTGSPIGRTPFSRRPKRRR